MFELERLKDWGKERRKRGCERMRAAELDAWEPEPPEGLAGNRGESELKVVTLH